MSQADIEGSSDHPLFSTRISGYYISWYELTSFDVAMMKTKTGAEVEVDGKKTVIEYSLRENVKGARESFVVLNDQSAFTKLKPLS